ncbi:polysaccharide biosynthesis tyrosine autokinase [Aeromicrobium fastidiosum]|uniref:polysaccharide biosynthesis tyrosine autokinase n=1 Tax=Aeromicrobium fastidiosum TaxID=52699 RepID=UPI0020232572|nr:polysaccharide biosynthesis tyrosine autokinase [Aeromicrobium fastidiosum]MCL8249807.1 polysaccharide biosynthesis tyrosine autokinase [Aeromicrobium fastidiosum]
MDLRDYLRLGRSQWNVILVCGLLLVAISALLTWRTTPQYASSARLFVSTQGSTDDTQANQGGQFSLQRVKSYADLLNGQAIARRVVDELDLDQSPKALASQISASSKLDTVILTVTVTDPDPKRARVLADAVANVFVSYVAELETPPGKDQATIKATVVDQASLPTTPVSPNAMRNLALGLVLGLAIGVAIAVLRETLDSTIKSAGHLEKLVPAPIIGAISYDSDAIDTPLITNLDTYAPRSEAFRVLRTNLQFIDPDAHHKVFVVTSSLPGEGKTTTAANLALALAEGGEKVILVEGDLRRPKVAEYLRLESSVGLTTVLIGKLSLEDAIQTTANEDLHVLTSGSTPPNPAELLKSSSMAALITSLRETYDIVLIDAPPLLPVTDGALLAAQADGALLVVRHGKTTTDQVTLAVERLEAVGAAPVGVIFNRTPAKGGDGYGYGYGYGYAPDEASKPSSDVKA